MPALESFSRNFQALAAAPGAPDWLSPLRASAMGAFLAAGLPTTKHEDWRYTSLTAIAGTDFSEPAAADPDEAALASLRAADLAELDGLDGPVLVFVNGRFSPGLSSPRSLPAGVRVSSMASQLASRPAILESSLAATAGAAAPFALLNTALFTDGALIELPAETELQGAIQLVHITVPGPTPHAAHVRNIFSLGAGCRATILESWVGTGPRSYLSNAVTHVRLAPRSALHHYRVQCEGDGAFHLSNVRVDQAAESRYVSWSVSLGGALVRNDISALLAASHAECVLNGLYLATDHQHVDNHTFIDHAQPHCRSSETYKGVLDRAARGVFNGKVLVRPGAQKTDASQSNRNLLLTREAEVDTRPQLEIYADDVKCTHGAAVGQLDEDALFYLRARGIPADVARNMLTYAFASDVLDGLALPPVKRRLQGLVRRWLDKSQERRG